MERYGTIPDKFTKEWWDYIWYYYKWHFIGGVSALILIAVTAAQCASKINYDAEITYVGSEYYNDDTVINSMCTDLGNIIEDANKNGKNQIYFRQLIIAKEGTPESLTEYNSGIITKVALEFQTGDAYVYLLTNDELHRIIDHNPNEKIFTPPEEYISDTGNLDIISTDAKLPCAIGLNADNKFLQKYGLTKEFPMYLAVRNMRERDKDDERQQTKYKNAVKIAQTMLQG